MEVTPFYKAPKQLFRSCGFVSKTGQIVEMNLTAKVVLMYMLDRTAFFTDEQQAEHYETQATIGDACGIERKAAGRALRLLVDGGVITAVKQRNLALSPHSQWYYKEVDTSVEMVERIDGILVSMDTGELLGVSADVEPEQNKEIVVDKPEQDEYIDDFLNSVDFGGFGG